MIFRILLLIALFGLTACNDTPGQVAEHTFPEVVQPVVKHVDPEPEQPDRKHVDPGPGQLDKLEAARKEAARLKAEGKLFDAADRLKIDGLDEEAYAIFAPADYKFDAKDHPDPSTREVSETPSVMRHSMVLNGKKVWFTAKAGHIITYGQKDPVTGEKDPKAAVFYMSYTRDDLPHENRPVTFLFNGGPGYASIFLHMAAYGPKRIVINAPYMAPKLADNPFPLIDNEETLLDNSDLVFVDPVSEGFSTAIAPHTNDHFSDAKTDAEIVRDFVTSYSNKNNRQSSPKYLLGESWGSARVSLAASLLEEAGTSNYDPDPSGKPVKVLSGVVLQSPYLLGESCDCNTGLPTDAMTAEYFQKRQTSWRGNRSLDQYANYIRQFAMQRYFPALEAYDGAKDNDGNVDAATLAVLEPALQEFRNIAGNKTLTWSDFSSGNILTNRPAAANYGSYDARMIADDYDPDFFDDTVLGDGVKDLLPAFLNYFSSGVKTVKDFHGNDVVSDEDYAIKGQRITGNDLGGVADLTSALDVNPDLKIMALHGYYDTSTLFFETEKQLQQAGLDKLIPVHLFEGGHMSYYSEAARKPLKKVFDEFYARVPATVATN
jgi:carboxypeptidase C (cathepsin A)